MPVRALSCRRSRVRVIKTFIKTKRTRLCADARNSSLPLIRLRLPRRRLGGGSGRADVHRLQRKTRADLSARAAELQRLGLRPAKCERRPFVVDLGLVSSNRGQYRPRPVGGDVAAAASGELGFFLRKTKTRCCHQLKHRTAQRAPPSAAPHLDPISAPHPSRGRRSERRATISTHNRKLQTSC